MEILPEIQELSQVIEPSLRGDSLFRYDVTNLTQPGDNYGSVLISIRAHLQRPGGELYFKRFVAKVPPTDEKYWRFIQPERTCLVENAIYKILAPALTVLQYEAGIPKDKHFDGFADFLGSRISLIPNAKAVDKDAILILEDLRDSNYIPSQRMNPFDLPHAELALKYMAQFHALSISLRLKKPEIFEKEVRPSFGKFDWHAAAPESKATMIAETLQDIREATNNDELMVERIEQLSSEFFSFLAAPTNENNPFNSIIHSDFWAMNLMFRHDSFGEPTKLKIIDFQTAQYDSIIHDLISFLLTSISTNVLEDKYQQLLHVYHDSFICTLIAVGANTSAYSFEAFLTELSRIAYIQVPHAIFMTRFILADDTTSTSQQDLDLSQILKNTNSKHVHWKLAEILRLAQKFNIL
ncbi:uncharacterized protein LOC132798520 isoform X1 [Drosophila nasuta]|uniref:uncharacterized protein LOC132798520 isoform X1 n=1 Tax=Drosophila nasuta TaxID=42062 RepID=UPI00295E6FDC|nr:uncharacterized protein LOC132798520 isoform X1 [Drosophila nasuta]